jgi:hypothetical protein
MSKKGCLSLARSLTTGEYCTYDINKGLDVEFEDVMQTVYDCGQVMNKTTLDEVRARAAI